MLFDIAHGLDVGGHASTFFTGSTVSFLDHRAPMGKVGTHAITARGVTTHLQFEIGWGRWGKVGRQQLRVNDRSARVLSFSSH